MLKWDRAQQAAWLVVALCACGFAWFMVANGAFTNDDLDNFITVRNGDLWRLMFMPMTGGHWSPFHRFSTWLVYVVAPMRFEAAIFVLMLFHVGTLAYLHATLRLFGLTVADKVILCMYASCALLIYGMIWWANAQLRVPHAFLCGAAIFHYVAWLKGKSQRHLWFAATAYVLDVFIYQKAVLIPVYMLVIGYLSEPARFRGKQWASAALPAGLLVVSILFTAVFKYLSPPQVYYPGINDVLRMESQFLTALSSGLMGLMVYKVEDLGSAYVIREHFATAFVVFALLVSTLRISPGTWKLWLLLLAVLILDYLPVSTSYRFKFGAIAPYSYRYHFETVYLVALFAGLFSAQLFGATARRSRATGAKMLPVTVVVVYLAMNIASLADITRKNAGEIGLARVSHVYMGNLRAGLDRIPEANPSFVDSEVPGYMRILVGPHRTAEVVPLFIPGARFTSAGKARYRVLESGEVVTQPQP